MNHFRKPLTALFAALLGIFFAYPIASPLASDAPASFSNKSAVLSLAVEFFRVEDKERDKDPYRFHPRTSPPLKDLIAKDWANIHFSFISYCSQSDFQISDTSFWGSRIELLSARPHPPTSYVF